MFPEPLSQSCPRGARYLARSSHSAACGGVKLVFDPKLRPKPWSDGTVMCAETHAAAACADIVLPSFEDEAHWFKNIDPMATAKPYQSLGAGDSFNGGDLVVRLCGADAESAACQGHATARQGALVPLD